MHLSKTGRRQSRVRGFGNLAERVVETGRGGKERLDYGDKAGWRLEVHGDGERGMSSIFASLRCETAGVLCYMEAATDLTSHRQSATPVLETVELSRHSSK